MPESSNKRGASGHQMIDTWSCRSRPPSLVGGSSFGVVVSDQIGIRWGQIVIIIIIIIFSTDHFLLIHYCPAETEF